MNDLLIWLNGCIAPIAGWTAAGRIATINAHAGGYTAGTLQLNNNITGRRINIASQEKSFLLKNKWIECGHAKRMDEKMKPGQSMKAQDAVPDFWTIGKYFLVEYRYQLVDRLNSALGQPSSELARIEARFLLCRMDPGESLAFIEVSLGLLAEQSLHRRNCRPRAI